MNEDGSSGVIELAAVLDSARRLKDRSVKLSIVTTQPISSKEFAILDEMTPRVGWMLFAENQFQDDDIPRMDAPSDLKSQGQRIRDILYVLYKEKNIQESFQEYYDRRTEEVISKFKNELDPREFNDNNYNRR